MSSTYRIPSLKTIKRTASKFEVVSLFAGGGGSSTGYRMAGGTVLLVNEFVPEARKTYRANWPDTIILPDDIRELEGPDILDAIGKGKGDLDLLDGSPPCAGFSTSGDISKGWGKVRTYMGKGKIKDVENLFFEFIRMLRDLEPKVFVAENVYGLTVGKSKGYLNEIIRGLRESGYHVEAKLLDAQWLGVPQSRRRIFFVGVRNDLWQGNMAGRLHPKPRAKRIPLSMAFDGLEITEEELEQTAVNGYAVFPFLTPLTSGVTRQDPRRFQLSNAHPDKPATTLCAQNSLGASTAYHWDNRAFTVRELKRMMSVPDDYVLTGTIQKQGERLGRMVPPLMMRAIADNLREVVFNA